MPKEFVIVFLMPEDVSRLILEIRRQFQPEADQSLPPHITIIPPFSLPDGEEGFRRIEEFNFRPKGITLGEIETFDQGKNNVAYLPCQGSILQQARDAVFQVFPKLRSSCSGDSAFHLTLARNVFGDELVALSSELEQKELARYFMPEGLKVFRKTHTSGWQRIK
ncbi:MAG: 2'-5' RNA ligase family protein [Patescibacteria group bacterium]